MANQRGKQRHHTYKTAHIVLDGGESLVRCSIRDLSESGAALEMSVDQHVPAEFDLLFEDERIERVMHGVWKSSKGMVLRRCKVVRRVGTRVGIQFE